MMDHISIKEKVMKHLEGLNKLERQYDSQKIIEVIAQRYDISTNMVEQALAEWQAGRQQMEIPEDEDK